MGTHQLIYIRTDGNKNIASGHLTRCLSIAMACRQLAMEVHFLVSDAESFSLLEGMMNSEIPFAILQFKTASYNHLEQELPEVIDILSTHITDASDSFSGVNSSTYFDTGVTMQNVSENKKPIFFLDSYYVTETYLTEIKPYAQIAYLDDLRLFDYPVNLLINYDVIPDSKMDSYQASYQNAQKLLLGASYTPLRSQFQGKQIPVRNKAADILITTGGSDPYHFTLAFIRQLEHLNYSNITFHIVIGKLNADKNALYEYGTRLPFLQLHENVNDMASLMLSCDLAVSAAGTTLYELCALGVPSISFTMADNQLTAAKAFSDTGAISCAGDLRENLSEVLQAVFQFLNDFCADDSFTKRKSAQEAMRGLIDGNGARRIAEVLKTL